MERFYRIDENGDPDPSDSLAANRPNPPEGYGRFPEQPSPFHGWNGSEWVEGLNTPAVKSHLKDRLVQIAQNKRRVAMLADRQEKIIAGVLRVTDIEIKVLRGILQQIGRNPITEGDITQADKDFMDAVQARADQVANATSAEDQIEADIENGTIADPDYDIENDPRWPL